MASLPKAALGAADVIFIEENGEGPGVRLRKARGRSGVGRASEAVACGSRKF